MAGLHVVIVPAWWPSPEQPMNGVFCVDYVRAFAAAGAKVGVVFPDLVSFRHIFSPTSKTWTPRIVEESVDGCPVIRIRGLHTALRMPGLQMRRFQAWLRRGLEVYRTRYGEPDILHAMCAIPAGWACTYLNDPLASRVVVTEHTAPFSLVMTPWAGQSFVRQALSEAARIVAVSAALREEMHQAGIGGQVDVIGNPIATEFAPAPPPPVARDEQGHPCFKGLFVGRLTEVKGIPTLIDAATAIARRGALNMEWHIAGYGPLEQDLRRQFKAAGLENSLRMHGYCERPIVARLLRESHFLVSTSSAETFSLAVAEALASGRPVVASDLLVHRALVGPGDGLLAPVGNATMVADAIVRLLQDYAAWDWRAIAARASERFSPSAIAAQYAKVFRSVISGPNTGDPQENAGLGASMES